MCNCVCKCGCKCSRRLYHCLTPIDLNTPVTYDVITPAGLGGPGRPRVRGRCLQPYSRVGYWRYRRHPGMWPPRSVPSPRSPRRQSVRLFPVQCQRPEATSSSSPSCMHHAVTGMGAARGSVTRGATKRLRSDWYMTLKS